MRVIEDFAGWSRGWRDHPAGSGHPRARRPRRGGDPQACPPRLRHRLAQEGLVRAPQGEAVEVLDVVRPPVGPGPRAAGRRRKRPWLSSCGGSALRPHRRGRLRRGPIPEARGPSAPRTAAAPQPTGPHHRGHRERRRISGLGHSRRRFERPGGGDRADARRRASFLRTSSGGSVDGPAQRRLLRVRRPPDDHRRTYALPPCSATSGS